MLPTDPPFEPAIKVLETARLSIRVDTEADYVRAFKELSDKALKEYFGLTDETLALQRQKAQHGMSTYRTSVVFFHLLERSMNKVIGNVAFHNWYPAHRRSEIGYAMGADEYKAKGYMREAIPAIVAFGFEAMALNRIEAFIHPDNAASRKCVERTGFTQEGWLREHFCYNNVLGDSLIYGLLQADYAKATSLSAPNSAMAAG